MGKKIRHLEFYGYADQNVYIGLPNVDLSDVREVNREQEKEINELSEEKADITVVNELSGKVDTFIDKQDKINKWLAKGINKNRERIDEIENRDSEITTKINEIVDDIDALNDGFDVVSSKTDNVVSTLNEHIAESEEFEESINTKVNEIEDSLDIKLDKDEAENTYAKKIDTYTKREVDDLIHGQSEEYATKQWVTNQGYIKETDANSRFATKSKVNALEDRVTNLQSTLYQQYSDLNYDLSQFKNVTNGRLNAIDGRLDNMKSDYDNKIEDLTQSTNAIQRQVSQNTETIAIINNISLPSKANQTDVDSLTSRVDTLQQNLNNKVDKVDYERDRGRIYDEINDLRDKKADKRYVDAVSGSIDTLSTKLDREIQNRINGDNTLDSKISSANTKINAIREENLSRDRKIRDLEYGLSAETRDREQAIINVIGTPSDIDEQNTIYGAKAYARKVANQTLNTAKVYTDDTNRQLKDYVDNQDNALDAKITGKADKTYVDTKDNQLEARLNSNIETEENRAKDAERALENAITAEKYRAIGEENEVKQSLHHTANVVHALTDWDGDDRIDYTDVGNGIIDVMHRELHQVKIDTSTTLFADAVYYRYDNKIHFRNKNGDDICSIDVSDFVCG